MQTTDVLTRTRATAAAAAVLLLVASLTLSGCGSNKPQYSDTPPPATEPAAPDLSDPTKAIESYTEWISYAYRIGNSDVALHAFSDYEEVRVNSYVQYNMLEGRLIEQSLESVDYDVAESSETTAVVAGVENWRYRYLDKDGIAYTSEELKASYDITYTVVFTPERGGWLVDKVEAQARGEVK